jgi:DNA-binding transcriptional regulator YdaS (Cro superfamily)
LYRIIRGKKVSLRVASTIDKATDGQVSIQELVGGIYEQHGN